MKSLIILVFVAAAAAMSYEGYHEISVGPLLSRAEVDIVMSLSKHEGDRLVVFYTEDITVNQPATMAVHPALMATVRKLFELHNIPMEIRDTNIQKHMDLVMAENELIKASHKNGPQGRAPVPDYYMTYDQQEAWLRQVASENADVEFITIGDSHTTANTPINAIVINQDSNLPVVWWDGGIHAREWLAPASTLWIIHTLVTSNDAAIQQLRTTHKWYFAPTLNPDGYEFTWSNDRLWRKNRNPNPGETCIGVDLNRNWDSNWGGEGASPSPCSETYRGTGAFSEDETRTVSNYLRQVANENLGRFKLYIGSHCYSRYWLVPYGGTDVKPPDYADLMVAGNVAVDAINDANTGGTGAGSWVVGTPPDILYVASGGAFDWVKQSLSVKYSYSPELRPGPNAANGFDQPAREIIPSGDEQAAALWALLRHIP